MQNKSRQGFPVPACGACDMMSSNTPVKGAKSSGTSQYFSLLPQNEAQNRPQNEDAIRGIRA